MAMSDGYFHTFPSPYHLKRLGSDIYKETEIIGYGINQYHEKCLIGLVNIKGILKYVNLSRRSHSLFQLHILTRSSKKAIDVPWKSFQLYGQNHVLIILEDTNQVLETKIPNSPNIDVSSVTVVAEHNTFVEFIYCNPLNSKTFISGTKGGEIKLWHVVHPKHKDGIPSTTLLWTIQAFEESLSACTLFYHRTNEVYHFLLFASNQKNHLKLFNLRTRKIEEETFVESNPLIIMKHIGGENNVPSYLATVNNIGTLYIWSLDLDLKQTLYIDRSYKVHCISSFYSPSIKGQVLVVCMSKKNENELEQINEDGISYLGETKEHLVRFYDLSTDSILKEFVMPSAVVFSSLVSTFQRGKNYLVIGNEKGVLNAWSISDLHLNPDGEHEAETEENEGEEVYDDDEGGGGNDKRPRLEITVDDDDDDDGVPQPMKKVPVPTPKELSSHRIFGLDDGDSDSDEEDVEDDTTPRTNTPVPFEIHNQSSHSVVANDNHTVKKHEKQKTQKSCGTMSTKKSNEAKYRPKVEDPAPPKKPVRARAGRSSGLAGTSNFGKPEEFTAVLEEETIRRTTLENDEPTHKLSRLRVMDREEMDRRIKEIEELELDEEEVLREEMARRERTVLGRPVGDGNLHPSTVPPTKLNYDNLVSLNVDPRKYEKTRKRVRKQLHPNFLEERKERKPRLFNEFFHPSVYDQEMAYVPKMKAEVSMEPMNVMNILDIGHDSDVFYGDVL